MGISGKDPARIFKSIILHKVKRAEGLSFLRNGGVTYVIDMGWPNANLIVATEVGDLIFLL
jgi:hypothetical protein